MLIFSQVVFTILGVKFVRDMLQIEAQGQGPQDRRSWRLQMWNIFTVLVLITVRFMVAHRLPSLMFFLLDPHHLSTR